MSGLVYFFCTRRSSRPILENDMIYATKACMISMKPEYFTYKAEYKVWDLVTIQKFQY